MNAITMQVRFIHATPHQNALAELHQLLAEYFTYYNNHRPHQQLDGLTPAHLYFGLPDTQPNPRAKPHSPPIHTNNRLKSGVPHSSDLKVQRVAYAAQMAVNKKYCFCISHAMPFLFCTLWYTYPF